jgi:hypothetical protein
MCATSPNAGSRSSILGGKHDAPRSMLLSALRRDRNLVKGAGARQPVGIALPRKVRRRMPRRWAESPNDLHDYANPVSPRRVSRRAHGVTGQSLSATIGRTRFRSVTRSCARSKAMGRSPAIKFARSRSGWKW